MQRSNCCVADRSLTPGLGVRPPAVSQAHHDDRMKPRLPRQVTTGCQRMSCWPRWHLWVREHGLDVPQCSGLRCSHREAWRHSCSSARTRAIECKAGWLTTGRRGAAGRPMRPLAASRADRSISSIRIAGGSQGVTMSSRPTSIPRRGAPAASNGTEDANGKPRHSRGAARASRETDGAAPPLRDAPTPRQRCSVLRPLAGDRRSWS
jgi:hypothetical protein